MGAQWFLGRFGLEGVWWEGGSWCTMVMVGKKLGSVLVWRGGAWW